MRELRPEKKSLSSPLKSDTIFVTGLTGVLGGSLLKELLERTHSKLFCLVRGQDKDHGRERLLSFLRVYDPDLVFQDEFNARVIPVLGDVTDKTFDLPEDEFQSLIDQVDVTIHAAACTNLFTTLNKLAPINLEGTKNVIEFALKTSQKYIAYVSTYTVMGDKTFDSKVIFKESDLDIGQGFKYMAYQQSKFLAESEIIQATTRGLKWNILRPGQIYGDSRTGYYPQGQTSVGGLFYDIFKTVTDTRTAFFSKTHFDIVPVDYVARGIVELALKRPVLYETYHLTNPDIKSYFQVVSLIKELGYPIEIISIPEYRELLVTKTLTCGGEEYRSATTMAFRYWFRFKQFDFNDSAITDSSYTRNILEAVGISCPKIDRKLFETYFENGIKTNYFLTPEQAQSTDPTQVRRPSQPLPSWMLE